MKRLLIIPLLCSLFLPSCNSSKKTYTITIESADHFNPSKKSLEFTENDFSPITLSYTTDKDYLVLDAKASDNAAECHVEYQKENEMEIVPCKNTNFTIKVTMTHLSEVSIIRIMEDENNHFHANRNKIVFKNNDFTPVSVRYVTDSYCRVNGAMERNNKAHCEIDYKTYTLTITPKDNGELFIDVSISELYKIVSFNPNGGTLSSFAKEQIFIPYDVGWSLCVNPNRQYASKGNFAFKGWSFTENPNLGGAVIQPTYRLDEDDPDTVYAVYQHNVKLVSDSLNFDGIDYYNSESKIRILFSLKNDGKYVLPVNDGKFTITNISGKEIANKTYQTVSSTEAYIELPLNEDIQDGVIKIIVEDYQPEYNVDTTSITEEDDHLYPSPIAEPKRGEDFVITIRAINETNDTTYYYVPNSREQFNISVKEGETYVRLSPDAYKIEFAAGDPYYQRGTITVFGQYVKGDLKIDATAAMASGYFYAFSGYGITFENDTDYMSGYHNSDALDETHKLKDDEAAGRVTRDDIAVKAITNDGLATWYMLDDFDKKYENTIVYSEAKKWFTLRSFAKTDINSVFIHVFDPNFSVFKNASWSQINQICSAPADYVDSMFDVGEVRDNVKIGNVNYSLRIIDMFHDTVTNTSRKAALTIELVELITNDDGSVYTGCWNKGTTYKGGQYDDYLEGTFFGQLSASLSSVIKQVDKRYCAVGERPTINRKVFPLALYEFNLVKVRHASDEEGTVYKYYEGTDTEYADPKRVKCPVNSTEPAKYWCRSANEIALERGTRIEKDGDCEYDYGYEKYGYMAAFCI